MEKIGKNIDMKTDAKYPKPTAITFDRMFERSWEVTEIVDNRKGFHIHVSASENTKADFIIGFSAVYGYRNADEGSRSQYWKSLGGYLKSGCYEAAGSDFLDWAIYESLDKELPTGLRHFIVVTANDVIDVLSFDEPEFTEDGAAA